MVVLSGDFKSRIGDRNDFIVNDELSDIIVINIVDIVAYSNDCAVI